VLAATLVVANPARAAVPMITRCRRSTDAEAAGRHRARDADRYLSCGALRRAVELIKTGEFVLATWSRAMPCAGSGVGRRHHQRRYHLHGNFHWVTLVGLLIQLLLVARVYRWVGVQGALVALPIVAALGYGLIVFVPIFSIIRLVKIAENSVNYSLMNTTRHALFLPVDRDAKYEGKTAIDTFFWRIGDLIQAGVVFAGLHWLDWTAANFALLNLALALVWIGLAFAIGREFRALAQKNSFNVPPEVGQPIPDLMYAPGQSFRHFVPEDAFRDADPGDANLARGSRAASR
jgi:AAA family ATP:ADP antiporter